MGLWWTILILTPNHPATHHYCTTNCAGSVEVVATIRGEQVSVVSKLADSFGTLKAKVWKYGNLGSGKWKTIKRKEGNKK